MHSPGRDARAKPPGDLAEWFDRYPALVVLAPAAFEAPARPRIPRSYLHSALAMLTPDRLLEDP